MCWPAPPPKNKKKHINVLVHPQNHTADPPVLQHAGLEVPDPERNVLKRGLPSVFSGCNNMLTALKIGLVPYIWQILCNDSSDLPGPTPHAPKRKGWRLQSPIVGHCCLWARARSYTSHEQKNMQTNC